MTITTRRVGSVQEVDPDCWDALEQGRSPFMRHGFLLSLEQSGSVGQGSGWLPEYVLAEEEGVLIGAVAAYLKTDSYGEYIFDWAWASASERAGIPYYPKLVVAAPFTPAAGHRFLVAPGHDPALVIATLGERLVERVIRDHLSSLHVLFCTDEESRALGRVGLARRASFQFHWHNRGYHSFDDFLATLRSRKRKQMRKERARAREAVDSIEFVAAAELEDRDFRAMDRFYRTTVWAHGGLDYLRPGFFEAVAANLPDSLLFARALRGDRIVAGAVFFETDRALYGRYWGADEELDFLHFEVAYYRAIDRCIERGLEVFEAGAQGEHKLLRGFEPTPTHSCHLIRHPGLHDAVRSFVDEEARVVAHRMRGLAEFGPYRRET